MDPQEVAAVLDDWEAADVSPRLRAGLELVVTLTTEPACIDAPFVASLRDAGLDRAAMEDAASVAFQFNFFNRIADAFDFVLHDEEGYERQARLLTFAAKMSPARRPDPPVAVDEYGVHRPRELADARAQLFDAPGALARGERVASESICAAAWSGIRGDEEAPRTSGPYLEKLARHAYKIVDDDVESLRVAGLDDLGIFELTVAGAFGASVAPIERLHGVLEGASS